MLYSKKDILKLIIPLLIEQVLVMSVGMFDTMMISVVGEDAVSGVSLVDTVNVLVINVFTAIATGGAVVAGHYLGEKREKEACRAAWQLVLFCFVSSVIVTALFLWQQEFLLTHIFGEIERNVYTSAKTYWFITALSIVPLAVYNASAAIFRSIGNSTITMLISLLMNILNVTGNYVLIYIADLGVKGAAIATTISRSITAILILALLFRKKYKINLIKQFTLKFYKPDIKKILYVGIPNGIENSFFQLGKILVLSIVATLGTSAIAANAVASTIAMFNILPGTAINYAILSIASYCIGAREKEQAKYYTKKLMLVIYGCIAVLSLLVIWGGEYILMLYHLTPESATLTLRVIRFHAFMAIFFWAPSFSLPSTLRAGGDVVFPMITATISMWVFRIAAAYVLCMYFKVGLMGIWIAMVVDWIFRGICFVIRYKSGKWYKVHRNESA